MEFKCKKCGYCCRTLLEYEDGVVMGLGLLTEEEKKLFNENEIAPAFAFGNEGKPTQTVSYQLILGKCPHIDEKNSCKIYEKRPLACRAYPITASFIRRMADLKCPEIGKHTEVELRTLMFSDAEEEAMQIANKIIWDSFSKYGKKGKFMRFDLATRTWKTVE